MGRQEKVEGGVEMKWWKRGRGERGRDERQFDEMGGRLMGRTVRGGTDAANAGRICWER